MGGCASAWFLLLPPALCTRALPLEELSSRLGRFLWSGHLCLASLKEVLEVAPGHPVLGARVVRKVVEESNLLVEVFELAVATVI